MNMSAIHKSAGLCSTCGIPIDANYFDDASFQAAPRRPGDTVELARYTLNPQYCGLLLYFAQYVQSKDPQPRNIFETPGYEWAILCNNQPRAPYLPTSLILNPWGQNNLPIHLRLEEGCEVRLVVRRVAIDPPIELVRVGGRLQGRFWYNTQYGGLT